MQQHFSAFSTFYIESLLSGKLQKISIFSHFELSEYALKFFLKLARQTMVNISSHISHLLLVLIAISFVNNEARKITSSSKTSVVNKLTATKNANANDEKLLKSLQNNEPLRPSLTTAVTPTKQDARDSKYSYFYVGRWTWHIPLWFTLWFSFYVFFNVIRSIYGHTVSLIQ